MADGGSPPLLERRIKLATKGAEEDLQITGFRKIQWKYRCALLLMPLTLGIFWILMYWMPRLKLWIWHIKVPLDEAELLLVEDTYKSYKTYYIKRIKTLPPRPDGIQYPVPSENGSCVKHLDTLRYVMIKKQTFIWDSDKKEFYALPGFEEGARAATFHKKARRGGWTVEEQKTRQAVYGKNDINVPYHSIAHLLFKEALNPYYIFQLFSVIVWFCDSYYYLAPAIVLMSVFSIGLSVYQTNKNQKNLRSNVHSVDNVTVIRKNGSQEMISSEELVPGDVIVIPSTGCLLTYDAILLSGSAVVNEAMLTGESTPETKSALPLSNPDLAYDELEHKRHTLFRGTVVIQTRNYVNHPVLAVVIRTGFMTTKGKLVRSILYPIPVDFKFETDSYKFIGLLSLLASVGFIYTCIRFVMRGHDSAGTIFLEAADLITIVIPPALPAAMTAGSLSAQNRLKKLGIFCIFPRAINVSGSINCVCFDKTGTLTEEGLDFMGTDSVSESEPSEIIKDSSLLAQKNYRLLQCMASCHTLTTINEKLCGDPTDLTVFESCNWILDEQVDPSIQKEDNILPTIVRPHPDSGQQGHDEEIAIIRQFAFTSMRQCMSVVTRVPESKCFRVFCKGSPEKIRQLCDKASISADFDKVLQGYTEKGYRVIAAATKLLSADLNYHNVQRLETKDVESNLSFLGLIILENRLKKETPAVIAELNEAKIRCVMITGDNLQTALSVAKECGMIPAQSNVIVVSADGSTAGGTAEVQFTLEAKGTASSTCSVTNGANGVSTWSKDAEKGDHNYHFALEGKSFAVIHERHPELLDRLCVRGTVFARMTPIQKEILVLELKSLGYYVGMCGDGSNDCGALKAAHSGISLSDAEASIASPFTSKEPNISCVPTLIREGRCALVTAFGIFKFMAAYSLTQFVSVMILQHFGTNLSDVQFLYIDLFLITIFATVFGFTRSYQGRLANRPPSNSLISTVPIVSLLLQLLSIISFQVIGLAYIQSRSWFVPCDLDNANVTNSSDREHNSTDSFNATSAEDEEGCYENYAVFTVSAFQYILLALVFSKSTPYRQRIYTNYILLGSMLVLFCFTIYLVLWPHPFLIRLTATLLPPEQHMADRYTLMAVVCVNIVVSVLFEEALVNILLVQLTNRMDDTRPHKYALLNEAMKQEEPSWPPLSRTWSHRGQHPAQQKTPRSPITTQLSFEIVDNEERAQNLFPFRRPKASSILGELAHNDSRSAAVLLNSPRAPARRGDAGGKVGN